MNPYSQISQIIAIVVLFLVVIHITASISWLANFEVTKTMAAIVSLVIVVNVFLIIGLLFHKKGILIIWLWIHGILLVTGAILDYPRVPVSMIVITATCFLAVYILLQTFDHHIRIEVRYSHPQENNASSVSPNMGAQLNGASNNSPQGDVDFSYFISLKTNFIDLPENRMTEQELLTISETIASQEMAIQQRYAAYMRLLTVGSDSELPTYEEVMKILEKEKSEKKTVESPPPPYSSSFEQNHTDNYALPNVVE